MIVKNRKHRVNQMRKALCCALLAAMPAVFISCKKKGPTDLAKLVEVVSSRSGKDYMDFVHKTHENSGIDCYQCHHKWENPDRIRNCSNCHKNDIEQITKDTCLKCHMADSK